MHSEIYTTECITGACRKSRCQPLNRQVEEQKPAPALIGSTDVSAIVSNKKPRSLDTTSRLQALTRKAKDIVRTQIPGDRDTILEVIHFAAQKVTKYRDIMPGADTLMKIRNSKVNKKRTKSKRVWGEVRVLTYQHVNEGLQQLKTEETQRLKRQVPADARKLAAVEEKAMHDILVDQ